MRLNNYNETELNGTAYAQVKRLFYDKQHIPSELCIKAVMEDVDSVLYMKTIPYEAALLAVRKNGCLFKRLTCPLSLPGVLTDLVPQTEELCKAAIESAPEMFEYVNDKTPELCKLAVQKRGTLIRFVPEQTDELCRVAIKESVHALNAITHQTDELCKEAVLLNPEALACVKNQTQELCLLAVKANANCVNFIIHPTRPLLKACVAVNPEVLSVLDNANLSGVSVINFRKWLLNETNQKGQEL